MNDAQTISLRGTKNYHFLGHTQCHKMQTFGSAISEKISSTVLSANATFMGSTPTEDNFFLFEL